jgi:branched-chain amino acid transport system substrate-binding protein
MITPWTWKSLPAACIALLASATSSSAGEPIVIGLDADFSGPLREVSIAVRQGAEAAIDQINTAGGVEGRPLELIVSDHRSNPRRARDNFEDGLNAGIVALIAGAQSTGALANLEAAQSAGIPLVSAFPGSTKITQNDLDPNPAFRISAADSQTNAFLVSEALKEGNGRIGLLIENSAWGSSNEAGANQAVGASESGEIVATGWFALGGEDFSVAIKTVLDAQPDTILLFGKPAQGIGLLQTLADIPDADRPKVLMHWGVAQGEAFGRAAAEVSGVDYGVFQTFSFRAPHDHYQANELLKITCRLHDICDADAALTPSPLAQGFDTLQLLALALRQTNEENGPSLVEALQNLPEHEGLIRHYNPAFTAERREALDQSNFMLVRYERGGVPVPIDWVVKAEK